MEDRQPAGLWLEMLDGSAHEATHRAKELAGSFTQVGVFANCHRDRTDLPRALPECDHLLVGEVDAAYGLDGLAAPRGFGFLRYPRPSQGVIGRQTNGLLLVLVSPKQPAQAQELRDWADFVHLRAIAAARVPGYTTITPYENALGGSPRFLHFYEMDTDDPEACFKGMTPLVGEQLGGYESPEFREWASTPALWIEYVNTFRRIA